MEKTKEKLKPEIINFAQLGTTADEMVKAIRQIQQGMKILSATPLKKDAIITLIHRHSNVNRTDIGIVLTNLEAMADIWLKKS